uniref:Protein arginine N-methyltransferase domain-containing protein n=1 Tax=Plectus sambesii TaxID=2011161 RepID=A0A914V8C3_9BILA
MVKFSLKEARRAASEDDPSTALMHYMGIIKALPTKASSLRQEFLSALGGHLRQLRHSENCETDVAQILALSRELYPHCGDVLNAFGEWWFSNGHTSNAADCFLQAVEAAEPSIDAQRNLANLGTHLVDQWHFRMLNDRARNEAYASAIEYFVKKQKEARNGECRVLDIGAGSGLLSVMASRAGASSPVFACEHDQLMCSLSRRVIADNQLRDNIVVLPRNSHDITPADLNGKVDLVVTELMDAGFFGEGIVSAVLDAKRRLLNNTGAVIPNKAEILAAVVECAAIARDHICLPETSGSHKVYVSKFCMDDSDEPYTSEFVTDLKGGFRLLTEPTVVYSIDMQSSEDLCRTKEGFSTSFDLRVNASGVAHAVIAWFRAYLTPDIVLESPPGSALCWEQAIFPLPTSLNLSLGESTELNVAIRDNWFRCSLQRASIDSSHCHVTNCSTIALMNDKTLRTAVEKWLRSATAFRPIAQVLDCARCPSVTRALSTTLPDAFILTVVEGVPPETTSVYADLFADNSKISIHPEMDSLPAAAIDAVICLPITHSGLLCGDSLQQVAFTRVRHRIDRVIPSKIVVRAALIESDQLLNRATVLSSANTCEVHVRQAFGPFCAHLQQDIELTTFKHRRLTDEFDAMMLDLEEALDADSNRLPRFLRQSASVDATVKTEGYAHGVLVSYELHGMCDDAINTADGGNCFNVSAQLFPKPDCFLVQGQVVSLHCSMYNGDLTFELKHADV